MLGVPHEAVRSWERGLNFRQDDLLLLAEATDTSIDWLVEGLTDRDVEEGEETAAAIAPLDASGVFPRSDDRVGVRALTGDEDLPTSIASALNVRPESLEISRDRGAERGGAAVRSPTLLLDLPDATLMSGAGAATFRLNRGDHTNAGGRILLSLVVGGRRRFEQASRSHEGAAGSAVFVSDSEDGSLRQTDGQYVSVFLPMQSVLKRAPQAEARLMQSIAPDLPPVRLFAAYASSLLKSADGLSHSFAAAAADHVADLCALMLGASGDERALAERRGVREAQRCRIAEAIEAGAATPGFTARSVAGRLGLTEREIHDLLWETGQSYTELVSDRRAAVAGARLADPRDAHLAIEEIAFLSGFMDFEKFNRAFEAQFGDTPEDYRAGRRTALRRPGLM